MPQLCYESSFTNMAEPSRKQVAILVANGVALWFGGAMLIQALAPMGALHGAGVVLFYALIIPGTVPFILLARQLADLRADQLVSGVAIVTATASLLDGCALVWAPQLYGPEPAGAGAAILWGVGVGLMLALVMARRRD